jgi:DNA primase
LDKTKGLWQCFNPACGETVTVWKDGEAKQVFRHSQGNIYTLLKKMGKDANPFAVRRILDAHQPKRESLEDRLASIREEAVAEEFTEFPTAPLERMANDFSNQAGPQKYMHDRGFDDETLMYFGIGYSNKQDMIITPMHDPKGMCVGFIGRSIEGKIFKNSRFLPKKRVPWNYHRAKKYGDIVIIVESAFDAMRIHQAGYPNVVALLGGSLSEEQLWLLERSFSKVIIMTDNDEAGRKLGHRIAELFAGTVYWAAYGDRDLYPRDTKDAGDMTDEEIRSCLRNAVSNFEYQNWGIEGSTTGSTRCVVL